MKQAHGECLTFPCVRISDATFSVRLIPDGDVSGAIEVAKADAPVDVMMGIGGSPEGVIAACALKCMGTFLSLPQK